MLRNTATWGGDTNIRVWCVSFRAKVAPMFICQARGYPRVISPKRSAEDIWRSGIDEGFGKPVFF